MTQDGANVESAVDLAHDVAYEKALWGPRADLNYLRFPTQRIIAYPPKSRHPHVGPPAFGPPFYTKNADFEVLITPPKLTKTIYNFNINLALYFKLV